MAPTTPRNLCPKCDRPALGPVGSLEGRTITWEDEKGHQWTTAAPTQHTPGPWIAGEWYPTEKPEVIQRDIVQKSERRRVIAKMLAPARSTDAQDQMDSNAALIASAPQLLEAAREVLAEARNDGRGLTFGETLLRDAILRAEGGR